MGWLGLLSIAAAQPSAADQPDKVKQTMETSVNSKSSSIRGGGGRRQCQAGGRGAGGSTGYARWGGRGETAILQTKNKLCAVDAVAGADKAGHPDQNKTVVCLMAVCQYKMLMPVFSGDAPRSFFYPFRRPLRRPVRAVGE